MALRSKKFIQAEHINTRWTALIKADEKESIANPEFWTQVSEKLKPFDHIEVQTEDRTFWADLLVLACGRGWATVQVLNFVEVENVSIDSVEEVEGLKIIHRGPQLNWCVIRKNDGTILQENLPNQGAAHRYGREYNRNILKQQTVEKKAA